MISDDTTTTVSRILNEQHLACLATRRGEGSYCNLVAFTPSSDLKTILFATPRTTEKYKNLHRNPLIALMVDNRSTIGPDFSAGLAVTALGIAQEASQQDESDWKAQHAGRHPTLSDFFNHPDCAVFRIRIDRYIVVTQVSEVRVLNMFD